MKKRGLAILLGLVFGISACGKDGGDSGKPSQDAMETNISPTPEAEQEILPLKLSVSREHMVTKDQLTKEDGASFPYGEVSYFNITAAEETQEAFPQLADNLPKLNEQWTKEASENLSFAAGMIGEDPEGALWAYHSDVYEKSLEVVRADEAVISCRVSCTADYNGAHPSNWEESFTIDTRSGELLPLCDVVTDMKALPQQILDHLEAVSAEYEFSDAEKEEFLGMIEGYVAENSISWVLTEDGIEFYFDPYALMYYAFGPIVAELDTADYPELIADAYRVPETSCVKAEISYEEGESKELAWSSISDAYYERMYGLEEEGKIGYAEGGLSGDEAYYVIEVPDWEESAAAEKEGDAATVFAWEEMERIDVAAEDAESWAKENGLEVPQNAYMGSASLISGGYLCEIQNDAELGFIGVDLYDKDGKNILGTYDFSHFLDVPADDNALAVMKIVNAIADSESGALYVCLAHGAYSELQPYTAVIVAVDLWDGRLLWRSDLLTCNSRNFVLYGDSIFCGYGFTDEEDYAYQLDAATGEQISKYKLSSAPRHFILSEDKLYVLCYNTVHVFKISQ